MKEVKKSHPLHNILKFSMNIKLIHDFFVSCFHPIAFMWHFGSNRNAISLFFFVFIERKKMKYTHSHPKNIHSVSYSIEKWQMIS